MNSGDLYVSVVVMEIEVKKKRSIEFGREFMEAFFKKKQVTPFLALCLIFTTLVLSSIIWYKVESKAETRNEMLQKTQQDSYQNAVCDAMYAAPEEVMPLVCLTKNSDMVTWNEEGDKVLLLTWHKYPESYIAGKSMELAWGPVWAFTDQEILAWFRDHKKGVKDWDLRMKQLIGLPPESDYTHFSAFWVSADDIYRPAYCTDVEQTTMYCEFQTQTSEEYKKWFNETILNSYYEEQYPWTRLGYTYDWYEDEVEYGLSEFVVAKGAKIDVECTYSNKEFIEWLSHEVEREETQ